MLTAIVGPMYSGKSSALIAAANSLLVAKKKIMLFKPSIDNRYGLESRIVAHSGESIACVTIPTDGPLKILDYVYAVHEDNIDAVLIDETQFFAPSIEAAIYSLLYVHGRRVFVAGLSCDANGKPFGSMPYIMAIADEVICLKAVCSECRELNSATRTYSKIKMESQIDVGGAEKYESRCFKHWSQKGNI